MSFAHYIYSQGVCSELRKKYMKNALEEYRLAVEENIIASQLEVDIRERKRAAHYKLLKAKEMLKNTTDELLEDTLINRSILKGYCINKYGTCEPDEKCDCNSDLSNSKVFINK